MFDTFLSYLQITKCWVLRCWFLAVSEQLVSFYCIEVLVNLNILNKTYVRIVSLFDNVIKTIRYWMIPNLRRCRCAVAVTFDATRRLLETLIYTYGYLMISILYILRFVIYIATVLLEKSKGNDLIVYKRYTVTYCTFVVTSRTWLVLKLSGCHPLRIKHYFTC